MIKGSILQEDITILNVHAHNNKVLKYIWQNLTELQGKVDESPIIVADFNTPLTEMDRSSRQKFSKYIVKPYSTINQLDIIGI